MALAGPRVDLAGLEQTNGLITADGGTAGRVRLRLSARGRGRTFRQGTFSTSPLCFWTLKFFRVLPGVTLCRAARLRRGTLTDRQSDHDQRGASHPTISPSLCRGEGDDILSKDVVPLPLSLFGLCQYLVIARVKYCSYLDSLYMSLLQVMWILYFDFTGEKLA